MDIKIPELNFYLQQINAVIRRLAKFVLKSDQRKKLGRKCSFQLKRNSSKMN